MSGSRALQQLIAMKRSPGADWKIADVRTLCQGLDLTGKSFPHGSHFVVSHPNVPGLLTIPSKRPIKPIYVMLLTQLAESALELE